jgi:hypothetical protein
MGRLRGIGLLCVVLACAVEDDPEGGGSSDTGTVTNANASATAASMSTTASATTDATTDTTTATTTSGETETETGSSSSSSSGEPPTPDDPIDCMGDFLECGDGKDNDGDGLFDLMDPECTGPCDDDEGSFQTGLPGDNVDCIQDCFFDGDSGQGNDGCIWVLTCDPANPGANIMCEYADSPSCEAMQPPNQSKDCVSFCLPYVPPGCDCFGCCTVHTDNGDVDIFLNSGDECSLDNLDGCETCTKSDDCVNECEPELCEPCFGEEELPEGCDEPACEFGDACEATADCPTNYYCVFDCCFPEPQG